MLIAARCRYRYASLKADTATAAQQKNPYIHCLLKAFDRVNEMMLSEGAALQLEKREERLRGKPSAAMSAPAAAKRPRETPPAAKRVKSADYSDASPLPKLPQPPVPTGTTDCKLDCLGEPPAAATAAAVAANSKEKAKDGNTSQPEKKAKSSPCDPKATPEDPKASWSRLKSKLMTQV